MNKSGRLTLQVRTQFYVQTNDCNLNRILNGIANHKVNIAAYCQSKKNKVNTVQFIVGTSESGNSRDDLVVRKILRSLGIMFRESKVIQILNIPAGIPGFIRSVYRALFRRVKVKAIYDGENNAQIVSVSNIKQALHILKKL